MEPNVPSTLGPWIDGGFQAYTVPAELFPGPNASTSFQDPRPEERSGASDKAVPQPDSECLGANSDSGRDNALLSTLQTLFFPKPPTPQTFGGDSAEERRVAAAIKLQHCYRRRQLRTLLNQRNCQGKTGKDARSRKRSTTRSSAVMNERARYGNVEAVKARIAERKQKYRDSQSKGTPAEPAALEESHTSEATHVTNAVADGDAALETVTA